MLQETAFFLSKVLWGLIRPSTLPVMLTVVGVVAVLSGRRWGKWPALAGISAFVLVTVLPLYGWLGLPLEDRFHRPAIEPAWIDGIVVLGGAVDQRLTATRGIVSLSCEAERMTEAVALMLRHPEAKLIFTGGSGNLESDELMEADVAHRLWLDLGIPDERMQFESASRNTYENAVNTYKLVQPKPNQVWLLVTAAGHMPRSVGVFRHAGWHVVPWPVSYHISKGADLWYDASYLVRMQEFEWNLREWIGLVAYRLMGRTDQIFPAPDGS
jgi:uncharacterized SAM-binding protein YcdF (DUF218 family)